MGGGSCKAVVADVNNDGHADVVLASADDFLFGGGVSILLGNGDGTLTAHATYNEGSNHLSVAIDDVNHDGYCDIVTAEWSSVSVLLGNGDGTFAAQATYSVGYYPHSVALDDLNHDGHVDIVTANRVDDNVSVLLGNGDGTFAVQTIYGVGDEPQSVVMDDLNHDGHVDIITANMASDNISVLLGNGDGTFAAQAIYSAGDYASSVALNDVNLDGHVDIVTGNSGTVSVLLGNGDGTFAAQATYNVGSYAHGSYAHSVALDDLNHDGHVDIVTANAASNSVLLGNGDGTFAAQTTYRVGYDANSVALDDLNHDGHVDIVTGRTSRGSFQVLVLLGNGDGTFAAQATYSIDVDPTRAALDDLNHDGHVDIVAVDHNAAAFTVLLGNGDGTFAAQATYGVGGGRPFSLALDDLNHDGHVDVVTANWDNSNVSVLLGYGDGTFAAPMTYSVGGSPRSVALDDVNHDRHVDIVTANQFGNNVSVLLGNGDGTFAAQATYSVGSYPHSVALDDLNHDGHVDIVTADVESNEVSVLLGNGNGTFAARVTYSVGYYPHSVALDDLNHDGHVDIVAANQYTDNVSLLLGNGDGTFAAQTTYDVGRWPYSVALDDLNYDGNVDIVTANSLDENVSVLLGNGDGTFVAQATYVTAYEPYSVALGDLNSDDRVDIVIGSGVVSVLLFRPRISHTPNRPVAAPVSSLEFRFRDTMDTTSFSLSEDVVSFMGPDGPLSPSGFSWLDPRTLVVAFQAQTTNGAYEMVVGPNILNYRGDGLDLDEDGTPCETPDDVYRASFSVDATGPRIVRHTPEGDVAGTVDHIFLYFSEPVNQQALSASEVRITAPGGGAVNPSSLKPVTDSIWEVYFQPQTEPGQYVVSAGPGIADLVGNLMDQDRDGILGEGTDDIYSSTFNIADVDLTLSNVNVDTAELWAGEPVNVSWDGSNQSGMPLLGEWTDAVYLSADAQWDIDDSLLAAVPHSGGLAQDEVYSEAVDLVLPGALPGDYYIIVRADLYNQEKEGAEEGNNVVAIGPLPLDVRPLTVDGAPVGGVLSAADTTDYYALEAESGRSYQILLDGLPAGAKGQFFVSYEAMPTRLDYDHRSSPDAMGRPQLALTANPGGTYYISVFAEDVTGDPIYNISATEANVIVSSITPDRHGVDRQCMMTITGAGFTPETVVEFVASDSSVRVPEQLRVLSPTTIVAVLGTPNWPEDVYDVVVSKPGVLPWQAADAFAVNSGAGNFEAHLIIPGNMDRLWRRTIWIEYANTGDSSMGAPLLTLHGDDNAMLTLDPSVPATLTDTFPPGISDTVQVMARGSGATPGILQPGDTGRIPVYFIGLKLPWDMFDGTIDFDLDYLSAAQTAVIDWATLKEDMQPAWIQDDAWDAVWLNFTNQVGDTWGDYVAMLDENMSYLHQSGDVPRSITEMVAFEYRQADGLSPIRYLAASLDGSVPTPGLSLDFVRAYAQPISRRYAVGALGRGWTHSWQISLDEDMDGTVRIYDMTGTPRLFLADGSGGYTARPGDNATLTRLGAAGFELRERSGQLKAFYADGRLKYIQDTNANRITAGYSGALLTSLTHSNGRRLLLEYYPNGRLWRLIDPLDPGNPGDDRITTYEYDVSGEYLLTVTAPGNRVTTYAYETGRTPQQRHALLSVEYPDGMHEYFSYDEAGRLTETHLDDGVEPVIYTYDSAGTVTVVDATGRQMVLGFGPGGQVGQVRDGEGNVIRLGYDDGYELRQITGGSGETYAYTYNDSGNVTGVEDPLRRDTRFTYTTTLDDLSSVTDARGNGMDYEYDAAGNLESITYEDETSESFTYDASGNVLTWTNRRGDTVAYTYDAAGQLISKDYPNTPEIDYLYTYDIAGNLLSATGPEGTTLMTYEPDTDWLARIEYPGGRWFAFDYDNAGRRTRRTDQDGNEVNYLYDPVGRLDEMRDGTNNLIVNYDYDLTGRLERKTLGNGVYTTYAYDAASRLTALDNLSPGGSPISFFHYTYDASGRRTSMETTEGTWQYGYDPLGQLTSVTYPDGHVVEYAYDAAGNRIEVIDDGMPTAYVTNSMNQYEQVGGVTYSYDADGNLACKTKDGVTTTYTYDVENRLVQVSTPTDVWTYTYDALSNRVASSHNGATTTYVVDPIGLGNVAAEYDASGAMIARYDHGLGLVSRTGDSSTLAYYTFDAIGSTSELTDIDGLPVNSYEYDPFGNVTAMTETVVNAFQFVGKYGVMNESSGLAFMRARFYEPDRGRFITADPLGLLGGDENVYRYVGNQPNRWTDPVGLVLVEAQLISLGGAARLQRALEDAVNSNNDSEYDNAMARNRAAAKDINDNQPNLDKATDSLIRDYIGGLVTEAATGLAGEAVGGLDDVIEAGQNVRTIWDGLKDGLKGGWFCAPTEDPVRPPGDTPGDNADDRPGTVPRQVPRPRDPNDKLGPAGFGDPNYVDLDDSLAYMIRFENVSSATAPAHKIIITDMLDDDLDLSTFELTEIGFAGNMIMVPKGLGNYHATIDVLVDNEYVAQTTLRVQMDVSLDRATRTLTCTLMGLDPQTGWLPEDILLGILYPNDDTGRGDGNISYTVKSLAGLPSGTEITNRARIYFDWNDPIDTPKVLNTIDSGTPASFVTALPAVTPINRATGEFTVSWSGNDDAGGSGLASYDVYVSDNDGPYTIWKQATTDNSATFEGQHGHTYRFYSVARDNVGLVETAPDTADTTTLVQDSTVPMIVGWSSAATHGVGGEVLLSIPDDGTFSEPRSPGIRRLVVQFMEPIAPASFTSSSIQIAGHDVNGDDVDLSGITIITSTRNGDTEGVIDFSALPNQAGYIVRIQGITDVAGNPLAGDDDRIIGTLIGDATGDGVVDAADYIALKRAFGSSVSSTNASIDFDCSGTVDYGDLMALMGNFGQRTISAPALPARAASVTPSTAGAVQDIVTEPTVVVAEPESSAPSVDEPAVAVAEPEPSAPSVDEPAAAVVTIVGLPVGPPAASSTLQATAGVLDALAHSGPRRLGTTPSTVRPSYAEPPNRFTVRVGPLHISTSPLLSSVRAGQVVADVLQLAGPWWSGDSARHESPDEPWMTRLAVDIAGRPRKDRLDPIELDVLAVNI